MFFFAPLCFSFAPLRETTPPFTDRVVFHRRLLRRCANVDVDPLVAAKPAATEDE